MDYIYFYINYKCIIWATKKVHVVESTLYSTQKKTFVSLLMLHNIFKTLNILNKIKKLFGPIKMHSLIM